MSSPPRKGRRLKSFRLSDVPPSVRHSAASVAVRKEENIVERMRIGLIAETPPPTIFWIPLDAWERVMGARHPKNRRRPR